ncbi:diguanylate cyclase/phosphodiesterase [Alkaliphilus metalliredigens QYMF]|uniref:Diguanylate cyclase/phosphodiesterase n=1 Tax=Alkaliphilus metalliredigens (strain QYMF) TaxID=293826 RepID=A6TSA8_ALKMQ|nr:EAL domain-containing protein [Alkaliphilus metalliredigens]ABR49076.1 diguanylate cyclase/phosphodiesterase [Alkaliphilus metalliredigens QYMF]
MPKSKHKVKNHIVNKYKLVYLPLFIGVLAILTVSVTSYYISKNLLLDEMKQGGINLANLTTRKINNEISSMKIINDLLEDGLKQARNPVINNEILKQEFNYQEIVESLAKEDNIAYALIVDKELKAIADSDIRDIGIVYTDDLEYLSTLKGETIATEWYSEDLNANVLEITVPLFDDGEIIGILGIGLSMKNVYGSIYFIFLSFSMITMIMVLLFLWAQHRNVIKPVDQLDQSIRQIDVEKNAGYRLPSPERDTFLGLFSSINAMLDEINHYFYQLKKQEAYIEHIAYHDDLTNLPNRRMLVEKLELEFTHNRSGAIMLLDLDNFKEINDTLGHVYGDKVLKKVTEALLHIKGENLVVSRLGGDEFLILIKEEEDILKIENYARKVIDLFSNKLLVEDDEVYLTCSIGIALYPSNSNSVSQLIMNADMAMYGVKGFGKNNYMFFNEEMLTNLNEKIEVENKLRIALKDDGFKLLYQPQIDTYTGEIVGFEALLRLKKSNLSPAQFIPVAEETGMIIEIGRWVTEAVIKQVALWKKKELSLKPIAINFSAKQLNDLSYIDFLQAKLKENHVEANYLEIEITEGLFLEKIEKTIEFVNQIKALGVKMALDDFGTGYSSLSYLTFLPVDKIKLDKSLSDKYLETKNFKMIGGIIALAHSLNLDVVAEGIEEEAQYIQLKAARSNYIQGYLFSRPLEVKEVEKIYNDNFLHKLLFEEYDE